MMMSSRKDDLKQRWISRSFWSVDLIQFTFGIFETRESKFRALSRVGLNDEEKFLLSWFNWGFTLWNGGEIEESLTEIKLFQGRFIPNTVSSLDEFFMSSFVDFSKRSTQSVSCHSIRDSYTPFLSHALYVSSTY